MNVIQELHQFEDGLRPPSPSVAHAWDGEKWALDASTIAVLEQQDIERLCASIDAAADRARNALAGDPLKAMEYAQAAADAQAYIDEGYPKKVVPLAVSAWVVKGRTARQAADQIVAKAAQFNESLLTLRTLRLKAKQQVKVHIAKGKTELANQVSDDAIASIRAVVSDFAG
ncbi:phage tail protein [Pseudomonas nunensis]|uniref:phage tail protein n=1 Tax=Pseudomonas nunensis TaxID=2961896 RepID=UPI0025AF021B|nr:phage tail protein [Pseudomonas nunensis]MDN3222756.1 phage tail protein [Pseudomonas nunensis]